MDLEKYFKDIIITKNNILKYVSNKNNIKELARITAISLATYYVIKKIYMAFFGPLVHVPGPFLSRIIKPISIKNNLLNGKRYKHIMELHEKYGNVVRISPDSISVMDKDIMKKIFVTDDLPKSPLYDIISGGTSVSMFTTRDKVFHRKRRRAVSPVFSVKYLVSLEPFMASVTSTLVNQISIELGRNKDLEGYGVVDIWSLSQRFALDIIGETGFGQSFKMIEENNHSMPTAIKKELKLKVFTSIFPFIAKTFIPESKQAHPYIYSFVKSVIDKRIESKDASRKDILQGFVNSQKSADKDDHLADDAIVAETGLLVSSGSETTGSTLGFTIIELLKNPDKLKKLLKEIDETPLEEGQTVFKHDDLKKLPYLNAVINETVRLYPAIAIGLPRISDKETILNAHLTIPEGITIFGNMYGANRSSEYWDEPLSFIPERWIPEEDTHVKQADPDAFFSFSAGSRVCIGKNFALQEMRFGISSILKHYEILPIEQELKDSEDQRVFITLMLKSNSFKVRIRKRVL